jgi:surface polysaccharide O-acyltransferase-like enzyme
LPDLLTGTGIAFFHLYFLLILLGLYLITPLLAGVRQLSTPALLGCIAALLVLVNADLLLRHYQNVALGNLSLHDRFIAFLPYYLLGYVIVHRWGGQVRYAGWLTGICTALITLLAWQKTATAGSWQGNVMISYENLLVVGLSIGMFGLLFRLGQWVEKHTRPHTHALISWLGRQSLWVYLLHIAALRLLERFPQFAPLTEWSYQPLKAVVVTILLVALCYGFLKPLSSLKAK